jgi:Holliday junction resolvase RusA-like endonuclease
VLTFVVYGEAATQGSFRALVSKGTKHAIVVKDNKKAQTDWRANVRDEVRKVMDGRDPMQGPVVLTMVITRPKPVSEPKRKPSWPWRKPDWDKLARAISDGLKDGGAYRDDAQVVKAVVVKAYPVSRDQRELSYDGTEAEWMLGLFEPGTSRDAMNTPGAVIRLAHLTEFPLVRKLLAEAGYEAKDITGGW